MPWCSIPNELHARRTRKGKRMTTPHLLVAEPGQICVSLIGMAACGKSAVGRGLAARLNWAHLDTDHLIEAAYAARLQRIMDNLGRERFLAVEDEIVRALRLRRTVISTGGSVIYSPGAMRHLATLGPIVHLDVPLPVILERIARKPERGLVIAPGQSVEDLFAERMALYRQWRTHVVETDGRGRAVDVAEAVADLLGLRPGETVLCAQA
jgi:shikimate kinase